MRGLDFIPQLPLCRCPDFLLQYAKRARLDKHSEVACAQNPVVSNSLRPRLSNEMLTKELSFKTVKLSLNNLQQCALAAAIFWTGWVDPVVNLVRLPPWLLVSFANFLQDMVLIWVTSFHPPWKETWLQICKRKQVAQLTKVSLLNLDIARLGVTERFRFNFLNFPCPPSTVGAVERSAVIAVIRVFVCCCKYGLRRFYLVKENSGRNFPSNFQLHIRIKLLLERRLQSLYCNINGKTDSLWNGMMENIALHTVNPSIFSLNLI